ncbi:MAG: 1-propanol dehydrogenase PduQ [Oscillospiraceae bacterium]|nr:1-propanol dehydrogenase PduQ [Oscillospiraceae bacterium]
MNKFEVLTDIYFGEDALQRLREIECKKVFIITDPFVVDSGLIRHIKKPLEAGGISYELFTDVVPDPPIEKVAEGVKAFIASGCDGIIGVGGGSALDLSKAVRKMSQQVNAELHPRLIAIPTTSGTGSEVTSFAVITDPETKTKIPLVSDDMTPDEAILDETLVMSVPAGVTADTGMDVLTHAIEAYVSTKTNEFSGALAEKAADICGQFLYRSYADNTDIHARRKMHIAACLAGLAFNTASLGLNHGMAHQLGAHFHIAHGRANAILLPTVIEYNSGITNISRDRDMKAGCVFRYCNIATTLGLHGTNEVMTIHSLCNYLRFMADDMNIPMHLSEFLKITKEQYEAELDSMADAALNDSCTETNPRVPTKAEVVELYRKIW